MTTNENYKSYSDSIIEEMWQALDDVPFDEQANGEMILSEKWLSFDEGTTRDDICIGSTSITVKAFTNFCMAIKNHLLTVHTVMRSCALYLTK